MSNKEKIEQLQAEIDKLKKQDEEQAAKYLTDLLFDDYGVAINYCDNINSYRITAYLYDKNNYRYDVSFESNKTIDIESSNTSIPLEIISQINDIVTKLGWLK